MDELTKVEAQLAVDPLNLDLLTRYSILVKRLDLKFDGLSLDEVVDKVVKPKYPLSGGPRDWDSAFYLDAEEYAEIEHCREAVVSELMLKLSSELLYERWHASIALIRRCESYALLYLPIFFDWYQSKIPLLDDHSLWLFNYLADVSGPWLIDKLHANEECRLNALEILEFLGCKLVPCIPQLAQFLERREELELRGTRQESLEQSEFLLRIHKLIDEIELGELRTVESIQGPVNFSFQAAYESRQRFFELELWIEEFGSWIGEYSQIELIDIEEVGSYETLVVANLKHNLPLNKWVAYCTELTVTNLYLDYQEDGGIVFHKKFDEPHLISCSDLYWWTNENFPHEMPDQMGAEFHLVSKVDGHVVFQTYCHST